MDHIQQVIDTLAPLGFSIDPVIHDLKEKISRENAELQALRDQPAKYDGKLPLYDFQKIGAMFMRASNGTLLADVPGLGKTVQTIASQENHPLRTLVLCPASLKYNWKEEISKWSDRTAQVIAGDKEERARQWPRYYNWTIANYELLLRDYEEISKIKWDEIVCDEATKISNPRAKSVKALKQISAPKKIALTGTPISNNPVDLWSIIDWIRPGYLGNFSQFKDKYVLTDWWGNVAGYINLDELSDRIAPLMLRRTKEEVFKDFPPKTTEDIVFELSAEERKVYEGVKQRILEEIQSYLGKIDQRTLALIPVKMLRLLQATDHLKLIGEKGESSKLAALKDILEPIIKSGEKVIVFTRFAEMAKILEKELKDQQPLMIYGDVPAEERQVLVNLFNTRGLCHPIMISTEAGAYGINLQSASYVVHYDLCWSVAKLEQREGRVHRIGQKKPVTVYRMIARNTIDEYVAKVLHKKHKISQDILQDADTGIEEKDIQQILKL